MNNNEELKEILEEMQENFQKGQKLIQKAKKHLGMPMGGMMGQRNFPHDLPPAYPHYPGEYDSWMSKMQMNNFGERNNSGDGANGGMSGGSMGERNHGGYNGRDGFDSRYM